jgi:hypothetical protein
MGIGHLVMPPWVYGNGRVFMNDIQHRCLLLLSLIFASLALAVCSGPVTKELEVVVVSQDLALGSNRISFLVRGDGKELRLPEVEISTYFVGDLDSTGELRDVQLALFRRWPMGDSGLYSVRLDLDTVGLWRAEVKTDRGNGDALFGNGFFNVASNSFTPSVGSEAPPSNNKTFRDVRNLEELTTARKADVRLYQMTVAEAIEIGKPLVLVFATPAFCSSRTCGPQLEEVQSIMSAYQGRVNFIHVEIYDNPHQIQGDLQNAVVAPAVLEWGLPNEPWTFLVDVDGRVVDKFEGYATGDELAQVLDQMLR